MRSHASAAMRSTGPSITVADYEEGRVFQRRGATADIVVSGAYTGRPATVEARVVLEGTKKEVVPWTVVDGSPSNGIFMGVLRHVPQGGWYNVQARQGDNHAILSRGSNKWGVGILVACLGQGFQP